MYHTPSQNSLVKQSIAPQAVAGAATVNGTGVDCAGYESALVDIEVGAIVAAAGKSLTIKLQESSDNGVADAFADITGATTSAIVAAGQNKPYLFDVNLSEREQYLRAVVTGGAADGGLVSVSIQLSNGRHLPPTQDNTAIQI
jgi:hypothetical protein